MNSKGKAVAIIGGTLAVTIAAALIGEAASGQSAPIANTGLVLKIYDKNGNLVYSSGPATRMRGPSMALPTGLTEGGGPYTVSLTVTNASVYTGTQTKAPYTFAITVSVVSGGVTLLNIPNEAHPMTANQTATFTWNFSIPLGNQGPLAVAAFLNNTAGTTLIQGLNSGNLSVTPAGITPGGTITF